MLKILLRIIVIILIAFFEIGFLQILGRPFSYFQIVLTVSIFTAVTFNLNRSFLWIILGGFLLDLYSSFAFGLNLLSILAAVLAVKILALKRIASHTFFSMVLLAALATVIYHCNFFILNKLLLFFGRSNLDYALGFFEIIWQALANAGIAAILFITFKKISKRFKVTYL